MSGRGFKRYPAYRDSGVDWLGRIPRHWEVKRLTDVSRNRGTLPHHRRPERAFGLNLGPEHRVTFGQMMDKLDDDAALDAAARVNTRENVRLTFESTLRWSLKEGRRNDNTVTHAALKTIAAFLNTEGGDLIIGVADDGSIVGIELDQFDNDDKFMLHLAQVVRNGLGDRSGTCIDPKTQIIGGKTVCVVSCQRSPEPVFLKWKGVEASPDGDFFVRSGPGTVRFPTDSASEYIRTRFRPLTSQTRSDV